MRTVTVVKCGGNALVDPRAVCADVAALTTRGDRVVLVHGGSADIEDLARRLHVPSRRLVAPDGVPARHTDPAMLEVVTLALAGLAKPRLVTALVQHGVDAVGLTGLDAGLLRARRKRAHRAVVEGRRVVVRDDQSGRIEEVNARLLCLMLERGVVPVVSPPAIAEDYGAVNVNADRVAAAIAVALGAATLILLTGAPGLLADPADETSLLRAYAVRREEPPEHTGGGMGLKLVAVREALLAGVGQVIIADGRRAEPVSAALAGQGTRLTLAAQEAVTRA
jgi:[amino group carrier protein]-L-2-aminoadipate 6-kinase